MYKETSVILSAFFDWRHSNVWFIICRKRLIFFYCFLIGDKFDIKDFHELFLSLGPVPLETLEDQVNKFIESNK